LAQGAPESRSTPGLRCLVRMPLLSRQPSSVFRNQLRSVLPASPSAPRTLHIAASAMGTVQVPLTSAGLDGLLQESDPFVALTSLSATALLLCALLAWAAVFSGTWKRGTLRGKLAKQVGSLVAQWQAQDLTIIPFKGSCFGAEVTGIDLHEYVLPETAKRLRHALQQHGLLLFRGQLPPLGDRDVLETAGVFGTPVPPEGLDTALNLYRVKDRDKDPTGADFWHSDNSYMVPPGGPTLLYALKVPRRRDGTAWGDTLFADAQAAAAGLPLGLRSRVEGTEAAHNMAHNGGVPLPPDLYQRGLPALPDAWHPVLRRNPTSGEEVLFVSPAYVRRLRGLEPEESRALLGSLYEHMLAKAYQHRHRWETGDLLVWDNGRLLHRATTLEMPPGAERVMLRVQTCSLHAD